MAAFRNGAYYSEAVAFLISTVLNVPTGGYCLSFSYSMRSNLRVKITSNRHTTTLANWAVDGGRAYHHTNLPLPKGIYKIIWETTDGRMVLGESGSPYHRYLVTVDEIHIHPYDCLEIGRQPFLWSLYYVFHIYIKLRHTYIYIQNPLHPRHEATCDMLMRLFYNLLIHKKNIIHIMNITP